MIRSFKNTIFLLIGLGLFLGFKTTSIFDLNHENSVIFDSVENYELEEKEDCETENLKFIKYSELNLRLFFGSNIKKNLNETIPPSNFVAVLTSPPNA
jgi:hypothetical protein